MTTEPLVDAGDNSEASIGEVVALVPCGGKESVVGCGNVEWFPYHGYSSQGAANQDMPPFTTSSGSESRSKVHDRGKEKSAFTPKPLVEGIC